MTNSRVKVGFFVDGNYILHTSNYYNYIHPTRRRLSVSGIINFFKRKIAEDCGVRPSDCLLTEAHYFRGRLNATDAQHRGNQLYNDRVFDDILITDGVHPHYLPLRNLAGKKEERGIDVWLSLECLEMALTKGFDYVILIVSDTDYVPLVRKLTSLGIKVVLASWEFQYVGVESQRVVTRTSQELLNIAQLPFSMCSIIDNGLQNGDRDIDDLFLNTTLVKPESPTSNNIATYNTEIESDTTQVDYLTSEQEPGEEISEILSIKQGYGFIKYPNNNLFFHHQDYIGDFSELKVGDTVQFEIGRNSSNELVAKSVVKITAPEPVADIDNESDKIVEDKIPKSLFFDWRRN